LLPVVIFPPPLDDGDGMADSYIAIDRYNGVASTVVGTISVGVNDEDTVKILNGTSGSVITEGSVISMEDDSGSAYQNTSGFDAIAVITIFATSAGVASRHVKIWSSSSANSATGTILFEVGQEDNAFFDASADRLTIGPLKIQNNNYLNIENVDDSRTGSNDILILDYHTGAVLSNLVVERGA
jgi:hypothetical protein